MYLVLSDAVWGIVLVLVRWYATKLLDLSIVSSGASLDYINAAVSTRLVPCQSRSYTTVSVRGG